MRVNGDMMILARDYRVLNQEELAERAGVSQSHIAKIEAGIKADIEVHYPLLKVPEHKASMIYRILQEVSQNTIKHANANHLLIQFFGDEKNLHILTEDNGIGFDVNTLINKKGMGLKSLESRVQYLEGQMDIDSKIGKGTTINMIIPIP